MKAVFKFVSNIIWWAVVLSVVLVATSLVLLKQLSPYIKEYRPQIESNLTQMIGYPVTIGDINVSFIGLDPKVVVKNINLTVSREGYADQQPIKLDTLSIQLDFLKSLIHFEPIFSLVRFSKPELRLVERDGELSMVGFSRTGSNEGRGFFRILNYLLNQDHISLLELDIELNSETYGLSSLYSEGIYLQRTEAGFGVFGDVVYSENPEKIEFKGEWIGDLSDPESLRFEGFLSLPEFSFAFDSFFPDQVLSKKSAGVAADVWVQYTPQDSLTLLGRFKSNSPDLLEDAYFINSIFKNYLK